MADDPKAGKLKINANNHWNFGDDGDIPFLIVKAMVPPSTSSATSSSARYGHVALYQGTPPKPLTVPDDDGVGYFPTVFAQDTPVTDVQMAMAARLIRLENHLRLMGVIYGDLAPLPPNEIAFPVSWDVTVTYNEYDQVIWPVNLGTVWSSNTSHNLGREPGVDKLAWVRMI
jgi:hypothetical protein